VRELLRADGEIERLERLRLAVVELAQRSAAMIRGATAMRCTLRLNFQASWRRVG